MVSALHVTFVKAIVQGEVDRVEQLERELQREPARSRAAAVTFISAVFEQAMYRRFHSDTSRADIIRFVARARVDGLLRSVGIRTAEGLITAYLQKDHDALRNLEPSELSRALIDLTIASLPTPPSAQTIDELLHRASNRADRAPGQ